jgi:hypothetical protein
LEHALNTSSRATAAEDVSGRMPKNRSATDTRGCGFIKAFGFVTPKLLIDCYSFRVGIRVVKQIVRKQSNCGNGDR